VEELVGLEGAGGLQEGEVRAAVDGDAGGEGAEFEGGQGVQAGLQGPGVGGGAEEAEDGPGGEGDKVRGEGGGVPVIVEDYLWRGGCGCGVPRVGVGRMKGRRIDVMGRRERMVSILGGAMVFWLWWRPLNLTLRGVVSGVAENGGERRVGWTYTVRSC